LEIQLFNRLPSTQSHLVTLLEQGEVQAPFAVMAREQYAGMGSRNNRWEGERGNFFVSFALPLSALPSDLPLASASIYFSFIMKKTLKESGEEVWLKWPNDFYIEKEKIGGTITKKVKDSLVCGMGINLKSSPHGYRALKSDISPETLLKHYFSHLLQFPEWKQVFSEYQIEFELSRRFSVHIEKRRQSLADAILCNDGSLIIEGKKVYSSR